MLAAPQRPDVKFLSKKYNTEVGSGGPEVFLDSFTLMKVRKAGVEYCKGDLSVCVMFNDWSRFSRITWSIKSHKFIYCYYLNERPYKVTEVRFAPFYKLVLVFKD